MAEYRQGYNPNRGWVLPPICIHGGIQALSESRQGFYTHRNPNTDRIHAAIPIGLKRQCEFRQARKPNRAQTQTESQLGFYPCWNTWCAFGPIGIPTGLLYPYRNSDWSPQQGQNLYRNSDRGKIGYAIYLIKSLTLLILRKTDILVYLGKQNYFKLSQRK